MKIFRIWRSFVNDSISDTSLNLEDRQRHVKNKSLSFKYDQMHMPRACDIFIYSSTLSNSDKASVHTAQIIPTILQCFNNIAV